jgi:hypothetical protein
LISQSRGLGDVYKRQDGADEDIRLSVDAFPVGVAAHNGGDA